MHKELHKKSLYEEAYTSMDRVHPVSFDFEGKIMEKTTSKHIRRNDRMRHFLGFIDHVFEELIKAVRRFQVLKNFTVSKNYDRIR